MCVKLSVCNQRLCMLCQLKRQGLPLNCLSLVFDSLITSRLMYASPSWSGYLNAECVSILFRNYSLNLLDGVLLVKVIRLLTYLKKMMKVFCYL